MPQPSADQLQAIPMSPNLGQSLARAKEFAREQSHRALLLEHLLLALTEDPEASGVLRACNVDILRLGTDVSGYLGGLTEDMRAAPGTEPTPDGELLRVIEAARQAAQQSRRRAIDGAIVLAAIVGDAKSPAAGLLKTHGMTFDEAIRTLQKASAQARSKQYAAPASPPSTTARPQPPPIQQAERERTQPAPEPPPAPPPAAAPDPPPASPSGQSVDDILAAARARIQKRSAGAAGGADASAPPPRPETPPNPAPKPAPKPAEPPPKTEPELPLMNLSSFTASPAPSPDMPDMPDMANMPNMPEPDLPPRIARPPAAPGLPPMPQGASPAPPLPPGGPQPPPEPSLPGLSDLQRSSEPRPPLQRPPERAPRGSRPNNAEPPTFGRPAAPNGALGGQRWPAAERTRPPVRSGPPPPRSGQRSAAGPLMEAIPRRMRAGTPTVAQVRIGRDKVDSLMHLLAGGRAPPAAGGAAHVLSVRLKAPEGGFTIDAETPETQWVEPGSGAQRDDPLGWRWIVTPEQSGHHRLLLVVAARTVDREGIGPEVAPPDRFIEVTVRANVTRRLLRWGIFALLIGFGVLVGRFSQDSLARDFVDIVVALWDTVVGLLVTSGFVSG